MGLDNPIHLLFIGVVLLLVFGAKRLPEMGRGLGDGLRGFKDAIGDHPSANPMQSIEPATAAATPVVKVADEPVREHETVA